MSPMLSASSSLDGWSPDLAPVRARIESRKREIALAVAAEARRRCPEGETGRLRAGIRVVRAGGGYKVFVPFPGAFVELGHDVVSHGRKAGHLAPNPFLRPALDAVAARYGEDSSGWGVARNDAGVMDATFGDSASAGPDGTDTLGGTIGMEYGAQAGEVLGNALGELAGEFFGPVGIVTGRTFGGRLGKSLGETVGRKMGDEASRYLDARMREKFGDEAADTAGDLAEWVWVNRAGIRRAVRRVR